MENRLQRILDAPERNGDILLSTLQNINKNEILPMLDKIISYLNTGLTDKRAQSDLKTQQLDQKLQYKKNILLCFIKLIDICGPVETIPVIVNSSLQHESSHVRLEALNVIIAALLRHENTQINFDELLGHISSILQDPSVKVRKVALDLCAVIQHRIGRGNMSLFLNSLSAPLKQQVEERLDQPGLPKVLPNGLIDYTNQQNKRVALPINAPSLTPQSKLNVNPANIPQILHKTTSHNIPDSKMNEKNGLSNMGISGSKLYTPANIYIGKTVQNQELITLSSPSASSVGQTNSLSTISPNSNESNQNSSFQSFGPQITPIAIKPPSPIHSNSIQSNQQQEKTEDMEGMETLNVRQLLMHNKFSAFPSPLLSSEYQSITSSLMDNQNEPIGLNQISNQSQLLQSSSNIQTSPTHQHIIFPSNKQAQVSPHLIQNNFNDNQTNQIPQYQPSQPSESINESNNASEAGSQSFTSGSLTPQKEQFSQRLKQRPSLIGIVGKPLVVRNVDGGIVGVDGSTEISTQSNDGQENKYEPSSPMQFNDTENYTSASISSAPTSIPSNSNSASMQSSMVSPTLAIRRQYRSQINTPPSAGSNKSQFVLPLSSRTPNIESQGEKRNQISNSISPISVHDRSPSFQHQSPQHCVSPTVFQASNSGQQINSVRTLSMFGIDQNVIFPAVTLKKTSEVELNAALESINAKQDWNRQNDGLNTLVALIRQRPDDLQDNLHVIIVALVSLAENLRSQLSRGALAELAEIFGVYGKLLDPEVETVFKVVMKKVLESNRFIEVGVDSVLASILASTTAIKTIPKLYTYSSHKSNIVRLRCFRFVAFGLSRLHIYKENWNLRLSSQDSSSQNQAQNDAQQIQQGLVSLKQNNYSSQSYLNRTSNLNQFDLLNWQGFQSLLGIVVKGLNDAATECREESRRAVYQIGIQTGAFNSPSGLQISSPLQKSQVQRLYPTKSATALITSSLSPRSSSIDNQLPSNESPEIWSARYILKADERASLLKAIGEIRADQDRYKIYSSVYYLPSENDREQQPLNQTQSLQSTHSLQSPLSRSYSIQTVNNSAGSLHSKIPSADQSRILLASEIAQMQSRNINDNNINIENKELQLIPLHKYRKGTGVVISQTRNTENQSALQKETGYNEQNDDENDKSESESLYG